ncbi:hypothetical protein GE061_002895 [Apolygus lucorum]|uniref:Uncharacterized protein n=1 Tax=Apolygus lucorum TaxID=248454 RepID=A0A6A4JRG0_APOLU|nr:hypothetical protein GE061_002895 [Apolygus lucorum]
MIAGMSSRKLNLPRRTDSMHRENSLSQIVQLVHNKFTNYMKKDLDQWEAIEVNREKQELENVKRLLLNHEENCRRIYILTLVMSAVFLFFYSHSSLGILLGLLSCFLVGVLILQIATLRMRQRKALYYIDLVNNLIANKFQIGGR